MTRNWKVKKASIDNSIRTFALKEIRDMWQPLKNTGSRKDFLNGDNSQSMY